MSAPMLDGRRALVVGAGSGIGRAVVERFTAEGAAVVAVERDEAKCEDLRGAVPDVEVVQGDACEAAVNHEAVSRCRDLHGGLDVLVHCVGIFDFYRSLDAVAEDAFDDAFDEMFSVNVRSAMHGVRAALPELRRSRGNIVLTESTSAYRPGRGGALYVSTKFAVRGLRIALAHDLAPDVRVNSVAPGGTVGTQLSGARSLGLGGRRLDGPGRAADIAARVPLQVALSGDDHAWSYLFLASPMSRGMTGAVLHSDGGAGVKG
ncbi:phthalate 3,4-dihydrodiol dehydrogenase [Actinomadura hallensis]|uniref:Phthalate 3,4-dihydrodiol dehydrogenase n=1 Tax=Actinomadura hallensis TaxID=337895 RepID=A0A543ICP9_9ACTN|nr:SDR family oxidoreductase [Actinomadura hallensis]TQM68355.1 phthalate 3,4-dihydrodiol dehydrogenase [Actinomadura hallensis]HLV72154.1 SDR family oxidoreductase [Vulgatibacteraceae bacterium]